MAWSRLRLLLVDCDLHSNEAICERLVVTEAMTQDDASFRHEWGDLSTLLP